MKKLFTFSTSLLATLTLASLATPAFADGANSNSIVGFVSSTKVPNVVDPSTPGIPSDMPGKAGALQLDYVSNFIFDNHEISTNDKNYYAKLDDKFKNPTFVELHDLRGGFTGWSVSVMQLGQFSDGTHTLNGAQLNFSGGSSVNTGTTSTSAYKPTVKSQFSLVPGGGPTIIMTADGTVGQFAEKFGTASDYKGTEVGGPISLSIPAGAAKAGSFTATIEWDLTAAPA